MERVSRKASRFSESVIREMTRLADQYGAINLAQGFPNFPAPESIKAAAIEAIRRDVNQYAVTWGAPDLRRSISVKYERCYGWSVDPEREVTVCCGATECMVATMLALLDPGQRVLVFEPFYENYGPDTIIAGADPIFFPLEASSGWAIDFERLDRTIGRLSGANSLRALILNTPNNPTGKVFSTEELKQIAALAVKHDFFVVTDEIYEHIVYDGLRHHPIALLDGMRDRTVTISGASKTFSVTGWRVGYIVAPPDLTNAIRKMHDFLTVGAAAPLQQAIASALLQGEEYYRHLATGYQDRRDFLLPILEDAGFRPYLPSGAYYVMADISGLTQLSDVEFVRRMVADFGVAAVPGSSFFAEPERGSHLVRFAFCKTRELLEEAGKRLLRLSR